jgi:hypothetical protein
MSRTKFFVWWVVKRKSIIDWAMCKVEYIFDQYETNLSRGSSVSIVSDVSDETNLSRGSSVSIVSVSDLTGIRPLTEAEDFSFSLCVQTGSWVYPASCPMGTGGPFPGGKARPGRDADHSLPWVGAMPTPPLPPQTPSWHVAGHPYLCETNSFCTFWDRTAVLKLDEILSVALELKRLDRQMTSSLYIHCTD